MTADRKERHGDFSQQARQIVQEATRERDDENEAEQDDARPSEQRDERKEATG